MRDRDFLSCLVRIFHELSLAKKGAPDPRGGFGFAIQAKMPQLFSAA